MSEILAQHHFQTFPTYGLLELRDADSDVLDDPGEMVGEAIANIAATRWHHLCVSTVHSELQVTADLVLWDSAPRLSPPTDDDQGLLHPGDLESLTGLLTLSSPTGDWTEFTLVTGPGVYTTAIEHQGRAAATQRRDNPREDRSSAAEHYTIHLWRTADVVPDDDDC
ncbi:hypothetical protein [Actinokineospora pegani]|uniref:hypothetical protein n=1 Tax=Actinokineospora pegani TaxID=2654637 RepID=UPI0012EA7E5C|nr:hypothetical protein [Actinokineospora pegani]